jgi:hypothetical protein
MQQMGAVTGKKHLSEVFDVLRDFLKSYGINSQEDMMKINGYECNFITGVVNPKKTISLR